MAHSTEDLLNRLFSQEGSFTFYENADSKQPNPLIKILKSIGLDTNTFILDHISNILHFDDIDLFNGAASIVREDSKKYILLQGGYIPIVHEPKDSKESGFPLRISFIKINSNAKP